jgi:AcrR family transcriptional regulator
MVMRRAQPRPSPAEIASGASPRGDARRRAILDAARDLFVEHGFDGVSMNEVVNRSGGSLATVYQQFGSKEGLFAAILQELSADIVAPFLDESI